MVDQRIKSAVMVAHKLWAAERAIEEAIQATASLSEGMSAATLEARVSPVVSQDAFDSGHASLAALITARREMVETHHRLLEIKDRVGLKSLAIGGGMPKPTKPDKLFEGKVAAVQDAA
jgi:hypothetical protein